MLFESFNITLSYQGVACELDVSELHNQTGVRSFEVIQGGIPILMLMFDKGEWKMYIIDDLPSVVKQDTLAFVSQELIELLIKAIVNYYDCFTERKLIWSL